MFSPKVLAAALVVFQAAVAYVNSATLSAPNTIVTTTTGQVQGSQSTTLGNGTPFTSWRGIPYAEPPLGQLRFSPPVPKSPWSGILDATEDGDICIQNSNPVNGSENCLFINVYVPENDGSALLPVMFWVYGGGFEGGFSSYSQFRPDYLLEEGVAFVSFNYRLGILGFAATGDSVSPGNNGLKDQVLALQWVQDNIASFGGDPNRVTIFGQSAGAASISYHLLSPLSEGLFHAAILESGSALSSWSLSLHNQELVKTVAGLFLIDVTSSQAMINGLRYVDAVSLQTAALNVETVYFLTVDPRQGYAFGPVSEPPGPGSFFSGKAHQLLSNGNFHKVPSIIGFNSLEGMLEITPTLRVYFTKYDAAPQMLPDVSMNLDITTSTIVGLSIKQKYFGGITALVSTQDLKIMEFLGDDQFVRSSRELARIQSFYGVPTYMYKFSFKGVLWLGPAGVVVPGVPHSGELGYIFGSNYSAIATPADIATRQRMVRMWTNFAKTHNPTPSPDPTLQNTIWQPCGLNLNFLEIDTNLVPSQRPNDDKMIYWDTWYLLFGRPPYTTH